MADNFNFTAGVGSVGASDDVGGVHYPKVKLVDGTADSSTVITADVGAKANALRVCPANDITDGTYIGDIKFGEAEPNSAAILADTTAILADTAAIQTAVELLDNAVDGNYLNVNTNIAGTDMVGGAGAVAAGVQRITLASDDPAVVDLAAIEVLQTTIAGDTTSIDGKITACNTGAVVLAASDGTDIGNVDVASVVPGIGATNLGKAEDAAHTSGDVGVMSLAVRFDAGGALAGTDLDYSPLQVDANGALRVTGGGGGTEYTEDVATANPIVGSAVMMERDDVIGALTPIEGDWASLRCSAEGALWVQDFNSDAALALLGTIDTDTGVIAGDTTSIDGKITACNTGAVVLSSGTVTTVSTVTNLSQLGGAAINMGEGTIDTGTQRVTLATDDDGVAHLATIAGDTTSLDGKITACNTGAVVISSGTITAVTAISNALPAGTNAIGKLAANSGVDIGDVDVTSVIPGVAATNLGKAEDAGHTTGDVGVMALGVANTADANISGTTLDYTPISTDLTGCVRITGKVAHDGADTGNPIKVGGKAYSFDGTVPGTAVAEADRAHFITDLYGRQYVETAHPRYFNARADYAGAQTNATVQAAPGAGLKLYITDIMISNGATAGNITLLDGSGGTVIWEIYPAIAGGCVANFKTPIVLTANTLLAITSTTVTTHSVAVQGYIAP